MKDRKGQATTFVLIGMVIVAIVVLVWFLRSQYIFGSVTPETLEERGIDPIRNHIFECVNDVAPDYLEKIGLQGGYLSTPVDTFRMKDGVSVSYLCYNMEDVPTCYNRYLTKGHMEEELSEAIKQGLGTCLNVQRFARGFDIEVGTLDVDVIVGDYETVVGVNLPIRLSRGTVVIEENEFEVDFDVPLGVLYGVSQDIVNVETQLGEFEQLSYMLAHKGEFVIDKKKPYPDKLYILKTKDSEYKFQFFVQGEAL